MSFLIFSALAAAAPFVDGSPVAATSFVRHTTRDRAAVHYYLAGGDAPSLPLLLFVQPSGCDPLFVPRKSGLRASAGQDLIARAADKRVAVMVVEKAGVESEGSSSGDGSAESCPSAFNAQHSLDGWTKRLSAAIDDARRRRLVGAGPVTVLGFSEGAVTAARLAARRHDVGKVAFVSGFGCDLWDDMLVGARRNAAKGQEEKAIAEATAGFAAVAADPQSTTRYVNGQTHLFWSTFGSACPADDLVRSRAEVKVFTGTGDERIDANGVEAITAKFLRARRPITVRRFLDGTHTLTTDREKPMENIGNVFREAVDWTAAASAK